MKLAGKELKQLVCEQCLTKYWILFYQRYVAATLKVILPKKKPLDTGGIKLNMLENCPLLSCLVFGMTLEYKLLKVLPFSSHIGICLRINLKSFNLCFDYT